MKKLLTLIAAFITTATVFNSCLKTDDAEADMYFYSSISSITYTDSADEEFYTDICKALDTLNLTGANSVHHETATDESGLAQSAINKCCQQADTYYRNLYSNVTLSKIKQAIFTAHVDSFIDLGYTKADSLPIDPFTIQTKITNGLNSDYFNITATFN